VLIGEQDGQSKWSGDNGLLLGHAWSATLSFMPTVTLGSCSLEALSHARLCYRPRPKDIISHPVSDFA